MSIPIDGRGDDGGGFSAMPTNLPRANGGNRLARTFGSALNGAAVRNFAPRFSFSRRMRFRGPPRLLAVLRRPAALVVVLGAAAVPAAVPAAGLAAVRVTGSAVQQIFAQCPSGHLSGGYSVAQLQQALTVMPAAVSEYTSCPDVVQSAIASSEHHRGGTAGAGAGGTVLPVPVIAGLAVLLATAGALGVMALRRR